MHVIRRKEIMHHGLFRIRAGWITLALLSGCLLIPVLAAAPAADPPVAPEVADLARARFEVADKACELVLHQSRAGVGSQRDAIEWLRRRAEARVEMPEPREQRIAFLQTYVEDMKKAEDHAKAMQAIGTENPTDLLLAQYDLLEAKMWLAKATRP